jgi:hypothetical protein
VRIDCPLCGVKMLDLNLYLSASVNVYHNKILSLDISLSIFVSIYLWWIIFLTSNTIFYHCVLSLHLPHSCLLDLINPYSPDGTRRNLQRQ